MEKRGLTTKIDMVNGPLLKNIFLFSVPLMFTNFLQMLFNTADTVVVGKFAGEVALAAVGATGSIVFLITSIFNGLGIGANVVIARLIGRQDEELVSKAVHTSMMMAIVSGILLSVAGIVFAKSLLMMVSTPSDILDLSGLYMKIYFSGALFLLIYNLGSAVLRSKGDTQRPLIFLCVSGGLNIVLNLFFVIVFQWSVAGVALATVISEGVAAFLVVRTLCRENDATRLTLNQLKLDRHLTWEILRIGLPAGIQGMVFSLSNVVIQSSINSFNSSTIVAANSAASNLENFVYIGTMAFNQATVTFTSQNLGANKKEAIFKIMGITLILTAISAFGIGAGLAYFGPVLLGFYTNEAAVIETGMLRLTIVTLWLGMNGILDVFVSSMRGMGYSTVPTVVMLVGICGVRLLWLAMVFAQLRTLESIYLCFPISWLVTGFVQAGLWIKIYRSMMKKKRRNFLNREIII